jgi:hypothetical protein
MPETMIELPAPMLRKFSTAEISEFLNARQAYERAVEDKNSFSRGPKVSGRSMRASIDPAILEMICELELEGENPEEITDEELRDFLESRAGLMLRKGDATLESIFRDLKFDSKILDAADRIADFWSQWYAVRKRYNVVEEFATERGKKLFRKEMTDRLWPKTVRERVKRKLKGLDSEAEEIRTDDKKFFEFVKEVAEEDQRVFKDSRNDYAGTFSKSEQRRATDDLQAFKKQKLSKVRRSTTSGVRLPDPSYDNDTKRNSEKSKGTSDKFPGKCFKCGKLGHRATNCFLNNSAKGAKRYSSQPRGDNKPGRGPTLPYLGMLETVKVKLNGKVDAEAILDSAASHTFVPLELVEKLGVEVEDQRGVKNVSWVAQGVSLPVLGKAEIDLALSTESGSSVILRRVKTLILPGKSLENSNTVFVGAAELQTLGIHPLLQLRRSLRRYDESDLEEGFEDERSSYPKVEVTKESQIPKNEKVVLISPNCKSTEICTKKSSNETENSALVTEGTEANSVVAIEATSLDDFVEQKAQESSSWLRSIVSKGNSLDLTGVDNHLKVCLLEHLNPLEWCDVENSRKELLLSIAKMIEGSEGIDTDQKVLLMKLALRFEDVWTLKLVHRAPALVTPSILRLKPGAVSKRAKARKYPQEHLDFMKKFVGELEKSGCIYRNPNSRWSSPVYVVRKSSGSFRMTIDLRYVNSQLEPVAGIMPNFEVALKKLSGSKFFSTIDCFKGYWQFSLSNESQEFMSFVVDNLVWTSTRLLQGQTDAVFMFQNGMTEVLGDLLEYCTLLWVDDVFQYARSFEALLSNLEIMFTRLKTKNIVLNPEKSTLCSTSVTWCGRRIDSTGVVFDDNLIRGLLKLERPVNAQQLQQFIGACNWVRSTIPRFSEEISPLQTMLLNYTRDAKSMKGSSLRKYKLEWNEKTNLCFQHIKTLLANQVKLAHFDPQSVLCLFTDASDSFYGIMLTQINSEEVDTPIWEQKHRPIAFLSGKFSNSQLKWSTIEKEAYPIVLSMQKLRHFLLTSKGFRLFTDHRNLVYVFNPNGVKKTANDRLLRWSDLISSFNFIVEHIPGSYNIWADILSRWHEKDPCTPILASLSLRVPTTLEEFQWPTKDDLKAAQDEQEYIPGNLDLVDNLLEKREKIWVPTRELQIRIMIIAHCSRSGHRGGDTTAQIVLGKFWWQTVVEDCRQFVQNCLHCSINEGKVVPRPIAEQMHATVRNQIIHYDYLYINEKNPNFSYILVIKEDFTNFTRLIPSKLRDHITVAEALLEWYADFGAPMVHISDQGSHFKNSVIKELHRLMGTQAHYTVAYSPWANGTVEVVNESILRCMRSLLSEFKMQLNEWPSLLPLVQGTLNHSPSRRLGGMSPVTLFTGLPAYDPFRIVFDKDSGQIRNHRISPEDLI